MLHVEAKRRDVAWNYAGTILSMVSGFILLPLLMRYLTTVELGLWYVYIAISNLVALFEFGFSPTFSRNIVYVISGARGLSSAGRPSYSGDDDVDWHLLNTVILTSKKIYAGIAIIAALLLLFVGTPYIVYVSKEVNSSVVVISWFIFCIAMIFNLYFLYAATVLRGYGDIAGENQTKVASRLSQILITFVLLLSDFGLIGASIGYLTNALIMRIVAMVKISRHTELEQGRKSDTRKVSGGESQKVFSTVIHVAWRDGVVQLSNYVASQSMSLFASVYLGLEATGAYSIMIQFATAIYNFASAYPRSFYPAFQSSYAVGETERQRQIVSQGLVAYWALFMLGIMGVSVCILPLLPIIKPGLTVELPLFIIICLYLGLWNQHGICCNYIVGMNEIPYMRGYVFAAFSGALLVEFLCGVHGAGIWGIVLGQALSQAIYNNWRWPVYLSRKLGTSYRELIKMGVKYWAGKCIEAR